MLKNVKEYQRASPLLVKYHIKKCKFTVETFLFLRSRFLSQQNFTKLAHKKSDALTIRDGLSPTCWNFSKKCETQYAMATKGSLSLPCQGGKRD